MSDMKVRWDAVVDRSRFWTETSPSPTPDQDSCSNSADPVSARIWLFGSLARVGEKRPLEVQFPRGFCLSDVFADLRRRYGDEFAARIMASDGAKPSHCRVTIDGLRADDMHSPIPAGPSPVVIEIILLAAIEGG